MIDSVLKGTGNSRFLKSAVPAGTSWADALAMLQAGTFPIDFNGINTDGFQQVGTPLNKANLLKDATAAQIGLPPSTTPDGMLQALGNTGELHVWRKTVTTAQEIPAGYTLGDAESGTAFSVPNAGSKNYVTLQYGPSITVNDDGGVSLTSVTGSIEFKQSSNVSVIYDIRNNFVKAIPNGTDTSAFDGVIFVPNDCSFKNTAGIVTFGKFYRVNAYPLTPAGTTTTYPVSTNPNAYQEGDDAKEAGYTLGDAVAMKLMYNGVGSGHYIAFDVSDSVSVTDSGGVSLAENTSVVELTPTNTTQFNSMRGKFFVNRGRYQCSTEIADGVIYFIPSDATVNVSSDSGGNIITCNKVQPVTGYAAIPAGTTIEYLGKLGDKARVQVVSYVGTGVAGPDNPNTLTFDFPPKFFAIMKNKSNYNYRTFAIRGVGWFSYVNNDGNNNYCIIRWEGKTVSWYSYRSYTNQQYNDIGETYYAIAIG